MVDAVRDVTDRVVRQIDQARRRRHADLILELDLTELLIESIPHDPFGAVMARRKTSLQTILDGIHRASRDPRVKALVAKLGGPRSHMAPARAQELRDAISEFRAEGKLTVAWAETFGEFGRGTVPYYFETGFEKIWLQPSGDVCLTGVAVEVPFVREVFDKVGIVPELAQRHEYKNAANTLTERDFTPAHREATEQLIRSLMDQLLAGIAEGRNLDHAELHSVVDRAPLFASEAHDAGLVDRLGYRDEVYAALREHVGDDSILQYVSHYARSGRSALDRLTRTSRDQLALIHVSGPIHLGKSGRRPLASSTAGSDTVCAALRAATEATGVKAIVLRVSSPGGSYVASDAIWRQVALTRQSGKPVVVSMGDVAGSGGYFVAMGADAIVAEPTTLTGSIGVVAGKLVVEALVGRLGVTHESVPSAQHSLMFSQLQGFSDDEWRRLNAWLDRIYDDFVAKVGEGRGLSPAQLDECARGRVWAGADARQRGLVDELGGSQTAIEIAKARAGLAPSTEPELVTYPRVPMVARFRRAASSEDPAAASAEVRLEAWGTFAALAAQLGLPAYGPLTMPANLQLH